MNVGSTCLPEWSTYMRRSLAPLPARVAWLVRTSRHAVALLLLHLSVQPRRNSERSENNAALMDPREELAASRSMHNIFNETTKYAVYY